MKLRLVIIFFLWAVSTCLYAGEPLTLEQCREAARQCGNYDLLYQIIENNRTPGSALARSDYQPKASAYGSMTYQSEAPNPASLTDFPFAVHPISKFQYHTGLLVNVPIYSGGQKGLYDALNTLDRDAEKLDVDTDAQRMNQTVNDLYLSVILGRKSGEILQHQLNTVLLKLEDTRRAFEAGNLYRNAVLEMEAKASTLEARLHGNEAEVAGTLVILKTLTGLDIESDTLLELPEIPDAASPAFDPGLARLELEGDRIALQNRLARAAALPRIEAFASVGYGKWPLNMFKRDPDFFGIVGLSLIVPISDWKVANNRRRMLDQASTAIEVKKENANLRKTAALLQFDAEIAKYEAMLLSGEQAVATYEALCEELDRMSLQGIASSSDYLAALEQLSSARLDNELYSILILQLKLRRETYLSTL